MPFTSPNKHLQPPLSLSSSPALSLSLSLSLSSLSSAVHLSQVSVAGRLWTSGMYLAIQSLTLDVGHGKFQVALDVTNLFGDACLVLTSNPKPRLRWITELHEIY